MKYNLHMENPIRYSAAHLMLQHPKHPKHIQPQDVVYQFDGKMYMQTETFSGVSEEEVMTGIGNRYPMVIRHYQVIDGRNQMVLEKFMAHPPKDVTGVIPPHIFNDSFEFPPSVVEFLEQQRMYREKTKDVSVGMY